MPRLLLLFSALALIACLATHAWCATRVLAMLAGRLCRCRLDRWEPPILPANEANQQAVSRDEAPALLFARQLHTLALRDWHQADPRGYRARAANQRFTTAVPPLALMVAVLASLAARIPWLHSLAAVIAATALVTVFSFLSLPGELAAINRTIRRVRDLNAFPHPDDESAIIRCARALAWDNALPAVLKLLRGKSPV